jgi:hypothetical protein
VRPVRVLSVPAGHRYVAHLAHPDRADGVVRLPDPPVPGAAPGVWWPPVALDPQWLRAHASELDLVHLHFGFESASPGRLREWTAVLRELDLPWVLTVHDLTNPHLVDQGRHAEHLDALVPSADARITLTPGAAHRIEEEWNVPSHVVPHPHMAPLERVGRRRCGPGRPMRVGVHLKSLRAHVDGVGVVDALTRACAAPALREEVRLVVHVHEEVRDPSFARHDADLVALLDEVEAQGSGEVHWVSPMDDEEFWAYLSSLDVSVLPYAWGTHSGWLEECRDLGTAVLAPDVGHYAEQGAVTTYRRTDQGPHVADLERALLHLRCRWPRAVTAAFRRAQRRQIAHAHQQVYRAVLGRHGRWVPA